MTNCVFCGRETLTRFYEINSHNFCRLAAIDKILEWADDAPIKMRAIMKTLELDENYTETKNTTLQGYRITELKKN